METTRSSNLKEFLQEELVLRCQKNPAYSLRSFARALDLSPSFLSKILNGHRRITDEVFDKISKALSLDSQQIQKFKPRSSQSSDSTEVVLQNIQLEYFKLISDWYHYAILELTHLASFENSPEWIASKLGITVNQAKAAVERLLALDLLIEEDGKLKVASGGNTTTKNEFTALAFKKMQNDLLELSIKSLWKDDLSKRDHTSICMATNSTDVAEVKRRLANMRREICGYLERPNRGPADQVYNLSLSFFSLTKGNV